MSLGVLETSKSVHTVLHSHILVGCLADAVIISVVCVIWCVPECVRDK